jgi:hypothetical protein
VKFQDGLKTIRSALETSQLIKDETIREALEALERSRITDIMRLGESDHVKNGYHEDLWYFAHPYSGYGINKFRIQEENWRKCLNRSCYLLSSGYPVFSPILHTHHAEIESPYIQNMTSEEKHFFFMKLDVTMIRKCNFTGLILAPGWKLSRGCLIEYSQFLALRKQIVEYENIVKRIENV